MRITFVLDDFLGGGAARVASILANAWVKDGWEVTILTTDDGSQPSVYPLDPKAKHQPLGLRGEESSRLGALMTNFGRVSKLRAAIKASKPDAVVSFINRNNILTLLATRGMKVPVIISDRNDPRVEILGQPWSTLRSKLYPRAKTLVLQTTAFTSFYSPDVQRKTVIIPNPVTLPADFEPSQHVRRPNTIMSVGRLAEQKGLDLLLTAFSKIAAKHADWNLEFVGEGPKREELAELSRSLGIAERVSMPGATRNAFASMASATFLVMPSRWEGFPNALVEAMSIGTPVIASRVGAVDEIVHNEKNGLSVPVEDVDALAVALERYIEDRTLREALGARAPEVLETFGIESVLKQWSGLIRRLTS